MQKMTCLKSGSTNFTIYAVICHTAFSKLKSLNRAYDTYYMHGLHSVGTAMLMKCAVPPLLQHPLSEGAEDGRPN